MKARKAFWMMTGLVLMATSACSSSDSDSSEKTNKSKLSSADSTETIEPSVNSNFDPGEIADSEDCQLAQDSGVLIPSKASLKFKANRSSQDACEWDGAESFKIHGRASWDVNVDFPQDIVVCQMQFSAPSSNTYYKDGLMITLNDKVLLSGSVDTGNLDIEDGFKVYDWSKLRGEALGSEHSSCPEGATCEIPDAKSNETLSLSLNDELNAKLVKDIENKKGAKVTLHAFGDNDKTDCTHSSIELKMTYLYFQK